MNRKQLLNKFLANQCSAEEAKLVFSWLNEDPKLLDDLISEDDWSAYIAREKSNKRGGDFLLKSLLVFFVFGLLFVCSNLLQDTANERTITSANRIKEIYYNPSLRTKEIITADESHIFLEPGAFIAVYIKPNLDLRQVRVLEGKVRFHVAKDPSKPFVVQSNQVMTTALGTQFTVDYNSRSAQVTVQLYEGKVRVASIDETIAKILKPGQQVYAAFSQLILSDFSQYAHASAPHTIERSGGVVRNANAYTYPTTMHQSDDWLQLDETSVSEIIQYINHELDMPVSYDSLLVRNYRLKGRFRKNRLMDLKDKTQLAESILQLIVEVNPFKLEKQQNTYILKPKK